jgi:hypothetical protein
MAILKGLTISLLGFLLFLCMSVFGFAFTVNQTILNPTWVVSKMNSLDASSLATDFFDLQVSRGELPPELGDSLTSTISKLEPTFEEQLGVATHTVYDYLLGESPELDMALTLRSTLLSKEFITSILNELDISPIVKEILREQVLAADLPGEILPYIDIYLDDAISEIEPELQVWLDEQMTPAADSMLDYLFGEADSFSVQISTASIKDDFRRGLKQSFFDYIPPTLGGKNTSELEEYFDQFYDEIVTPQIPSAIQLDESLFGPQAPEQISLALFEAEETLAEAREYVAQFYLWYYVLIGFMVLLAAAIILLIRTVKGATREIGIIFLTYGAFEYGLILATRHWALPELSGYFAQFPMPAALQAWLPQLFADFLKPLEILSLSFLIGGVVLVVASFVYRRGEAAD